MDSAANLIGAAKERTATCEKHGAYTQRAIPVWGEKVIWSRCQKCTEEQDAQDKARRIEKAAAAAQERIEQRLRSAGIPLRFRDRTIDSFVATTAEQQHAKTTAGEIVANWSDHRKRGTSIVFSGTPGTGKSHLAIAILQQVMRFGTGMYLNALDLVRMVRDTWRRDSAKSESDVLDMLGSLDLLVIDEVGVQYGTEGEQMILFDVLNRRYRDCMPTIMLTNLRSADFEQYIGVRAFDRLKEGGIWLRFAWDSYRGSSCD